MRTSRSIGGSIFAILLAFPVALFPAALAADVTYLNTAQVQWSNFASWLIAGAVLVTGLLLVWTIVAMVFGDRKGRVLEVALWAVLLAAGVINALQHAKDGWNSVGALGLGLSILCTLLAFALCVVSSPVTSVRERAA